MSLWIGGMLLREPGPSLFVAWLPSPVAAKSHCLVLDGVTGQAHSPELVEGISSTSGYEVCLTSGESSWLGSWSHRCPVSCTALPAALPNLAASQGLLLNTSAFPWLSPCSTAFSLLVCCCFVEETRSGYLWHCWNQGSQHRFPVG